MGVWDERDKEGWPCRIEEREGMTQGKCGGCYIREGDTKSGQMFKFTFNCSISKMTFLALNVELKMLRRHLNQLRRRK